MNIKELVFLRNVLFPAPSCASFSDNMSLGGSHEAVHISILFFYMRVIRCVCLSVCACADLHMWVSVLVGETYVYLPIHFYEYEINMR